MTSEPNTTDEHPVISIRGVEKHYPAPRTSLRGGRPMIRAVRGVDLEVAPGRTLGIVGESGSGKSTLGRMALALTPPSAGQVLINGVDPAGLRGGMLRRTRRVVQGVFQDPTSALDPRRTIGESIGEPLQAMGLARAEIADQVERLLDLVGLDPRRAPERPGRFSGGQRQRVVIARALAVSPRAIVADEPVSALDVSVQAQILNLFRDLQERESLAMMFISHDLAVIGFVADDIAVMYRGSIVESGATADVLSGPLHPYTHALAAAARGIGDAAAVPAVAEAFDVRCGADGRTCTPDGPLLVEVAPGRRVACHLVAGSS